MMKRQEMFAVILKQHMQGGVFIMERRQGLLTISLLPYAIRHSIVRRNKLSAMPMSAMPMSAVLFFRYHCGMSLVDDIYPT